MPEAWKTVAGWDPGASGAVCALLLDASGHVQSVESLRFSRSTPTDVVDFLREFQPDFTVLEKVTSFGMGRGSAFKFGASFGFAQGVLLSLGLPFELVTPPKWQKPFSVPKSDGPQRKRELKAIAQRLYPGRQLVLEDADAHLIAEYARRLLLQRSK